MFQKLFLLFLGALGGVTTTVTSPAPQSTTPTKSPTPVLTIVKKTATSTPEQTTKTVKKVSTTAPKNTSKKSEQKPITKKTVPESVVSTKPPEVLPASTTPATPPLPPPDFNAVNETARKALVNIICTSATGGIFDPLSASGVIIDSRGIILTNAHVAQFFLLENSRGQSLLNCIGRTGSPATPTYTLQLLYISPEWVRENYKDILKQNPTGTGENDFALLQITGSTNPDLTIKPPFPYLPVDNNEDNIRTGDASVIVGYPAGFLGGIAIQRDLYIVSSIISIGQRYTFKTGTLDAFSLGGSPVAQHGSSGGGAVSPYGKLLGIIVTSTDAKETSGRNLDAISIAHINRKLGAETNMTLESLQTSDLKYFSENFSTKILPELKKLYFDKLVSKNR